MRRAGEHFVREPCVLKRKDRAYSWRDSAVLEHLIEKLEAGGCHVGIEEHRINIFAIRQGLLRHHGDQLATLLQRSHRLLQSLAPDEVENGIDLRKLAHKVRPIRLRNDICTQLAQKIFVFLPRNRNDGDTGTYRHLHRVGADVSGCTHYQNGIAPLRLRVLEHHLKCSHCDHRSRPSLQVVKRARFEGDHVTFTDCEFCLRSHELRIGYTVDGIASTKPCHAIAYTLHNTGKVRTQSEGRLWTDLTPAFANDRVPRSYASRVHMHQNLIRPR